MRREGELCQVVDIANGAEFDLSDEAVVEAWETRVRRREWAAAGLCPVCSSLSRGLHPRVRDGEFPWGLPVSQLPLRLKKMAGVDYLAYHNRMLVGFFRLLWATLQTCMHVCTGPWVCIHV